MANRILVNKLVRTYVAEIGYVSKGAVPAEQPIDLFLNGPAYSMRPSYTLV